MADPIAIAEKIIKAAIFIHKVVEDVKTFVDLAKKLDYKIQLMKPSLDFLSNMKSQRKQLNDACQQEPQLNLIGSSLSEMLMCITEVQEFIDYIKSMSNLKKVKERGSVNVKYANLAWKLDELQKSILFGVITEVRDEVTKTKGTDKVKSLVKHVRTSATLSVASARSMPENIGAAKGAESSPRPSTVPVLAFNDLDLVELLGEGGFGSVWSANHKHGQEVAVKIFDVANNREVLKEATKMQRAINSPYIVRLVGIIDERECQAIVMDYFQYGSLKSFMTYLDCDCWARRIRMLCDISIGINYLHNMTPPIVHKDIKACNIFIDHGLMAKLGDLGLSTSSTTVRTRSQAVIAGTVSHIPPEAWGGTVKEAKKSWDIYEFGITLYEFSSGESPWPSYATDTMIRGWVYTDDKRPDKKNVKDSTPKEVKQLMRKCWQRKPDARPTSQEIQKLLTALFDQNYKKNLVRADMAIRQQLLTSTPDVREEMGSSTSADSGIASTELNLRAMNVKDTNKAQTRTDNEIDLKWKLKHEIPLYGSLHFVASDRLAICRRDNESVEVHQVTREETHLLYTLRSNEWTAFINYPQDVAVAVNDTIEQPDDILVICGYKYVYQFPSHESVQYVKKYQIHDESVESVDPRCIAANANTAVIGLYSMALVVCSLPGFTQQSIVRLSFTPYDLSITTHYLLVMGDKEMVVKPLGNMSQDLCSIQPPDDWVFYAAAFRNDARQIYAACFNRGDRPCCVYKYTWGGNDTPQYINAGRVIDDLRRVGGRGLSVTTDGLLAVSDSGGTKIFSLE